MFYFDILSRKLSEQLKVFLSCRVTYGATILSIYISFNNLRLKEDLEEREERLEKSYERELSSYGTLTIIQETGALITTIS